MLTGDGSNNVIHGGAGGDTIIGGDGNDTIDGGLGSDRLIADGGTLAGTGNDLFRFLNPGQGGDIIVAFNNAGADKISIVKSGFGIGMAVDHGAAGAQDFDAHYFVLGTTATEAHRQLLFDDPSHQLFWDSDGSDAQAAVLLATLTNGATLHAAEFELKYRGARRTSPWKPVGAGCPRPPLALAAAQRHDPAG